MDSLVSGLYEWGVPKKDVKFEAFGPATVKAGAKEGAPKQQLVISRPLKLNSRVVEKNPLVITDSFSAESACICREDGHPYRLQLRRRKLWILPCGDQKEQYATEPST